MEHLAIALRNNPSVHGITVGPTQTKLALFADDLLLFVTRPHLSLPSVMQEFQRFGEVSNFKVNYNKLEILNISLPKSDLHRLSTAFSFKMGSTSIRYLGIQIPECGFQLFSKNFTPLLLRTQADLSTYTFKRLSWLGRVNTLKMDVLPRFLYLFQTIPIYIPNSYFRKLRQLFSKFIWNSAHPRIRYRTLSLPKVRGGAGAPDASLYNKAAILTRILDWFHNHTTKLWVHLESHMNSIDLSALPWTTPAIRRGSHPLCDLTRQTIQIWDRLISNGNISNPSGTMTPLFGTPAFPPAMHVTRFGPWRKEDHRRLSQFLRADPTLMPDTPPRIVFSIPYAMTSETTTDFLYPNLPINTRYSS